MSFLTSAEFPLRHTHLDDAVAARRLGGVSASLTETHQQALGDAFRVEREMGGGGMSRVFVAHDLSLDRDVVIEVLSAESTEGISADRLRREGALPVQTR